MGRSTSWTVGEVLTSTDMNNMPRGKLGYAEVTTDQTPITAEVDLTSLSVTCTPGTSRRIRVTGCVLVGSDTNLDEITLRIKEGSTVLQTAQLTVPAAGRAFSLEATAVLSPTSASHTYKLSLERHTGSGNVTRNADPTFPAFVLVEDIGA